MTRGDADEDVRAPSIKWLVDVVGISHGAAEQIVEYLATDQSWRWA